MQGKLDFKLIGVMYSELLSQSGVMITSLWYEYCGVVRSPTCGVVWALLPALVCVATDTLLFMTFKCCVLSH